MPNPEELARENIDKQLEACGGSVHVRSGLMTRERLYEIMENYAQLIANHMKSQVIP